MICSSFMFNHLTILLNYKTEQPMRIRTAKKADTSQGCLQAILKTNFCFALKMISNTT